MNYYYGFFVMSSFSKNQTEFGLSESAKLN